MKCFLNVSGHCSLIFISPRINNFGGFSPEQNVLNWQIRLIEVKKSKYSSSLQLVVTRGSTSQHWSKAAFNSSDWVIKLARENNRTCLQDNIAFMHKLLLPTRLFLIVLKANQSLGSFFARILSLNTHACVVCLDVWSKVDLKESFFDHSYTTLSVYKKNCCTKGNERSDCIVELTSAK